MRRFDIISLLFKKLTLLIIAIFFMATGMIAQKAIVKEEIWNIKTTDGNQYFGPIVYENTVTLIIETAMTGPITIRKKNIQSKEKVAANYWIKRRVYWPVNEQANKYFLGPSAFNLKRGQGYYQNDWVIWNQFDYGLTDKVSLGVGMIPYVQEEDQHTPVWLTTKVQIPTQKDNFHLAAGTLFTTSFNVERRSTPFRSASVYLVGTLGNRDYNIGMGLAYGVQEWEWLERPMIHLSGMARLTKNGFMMVEFFLSNPSTLYKRVAFFGSRTRWYTASLNYGIAFAEGDSENGIPDVVPWLAFTVPLR